MIIHLNWQWLQFNNRKSPTHLTTCSLKAKLFPAQAHVHTHTYMHTHRHTHAVPGALQRRRDTVPVWPLLPGQESQSESCSVVSDSSRPHGIYSPWNSPGQNTVVGSLSLLQGIFPTQGSNPGLPHCRQVPGASLKTTAQLSCAAQWLHWKMQVSRSKASSTSSRPL